MLWKEHIGIRGEGYKELREIFKGSEKHMNPPSNLEGRGLERSKLRRDLSVRYGTRIVRSKKKLY